MTTPGLAPVIRPGRAGDEEGIARAHVAGWRAAYRGIISDATLDALDVEERAAMWRARLLALDADPPPRGEALYVAVGAEGGAGGADGADGVGGVVGFARGGRARPLASGAAPAPYDGEIYAIYLLPGAMRRGAGARLVHALATRLAADGIASLLVWVLSANPNRGFYEALGGAPVFEQETDLGGEPLPETAYGWPDIHRLIARTAG